jgi:hypothetical protein
LRSLLLIKVSFHSRTSIFWHILLRKRLAQRKTTPTTVREKGTKKRERTESVIDSIVSSTSTINPVLAGILHRATSTAEGDVQEIPKVVTGKGIKHDLNGYLKNPAEAPGHRATIRTWR